MRKKDLMDLAANQDFVSGIYNYCDRWCERCTFTSRCLLYATEQADEELNDPETRDIHNEKFWRKLESSFQNTAEMIAEWAAERGIDLEAIGMSAEMTEQERQLEAAKQNELTRTAHKYAMGVETWMREELETEAEVHHDTSPEPADDEISIGIQDAVEIIRWYQLFIEVKLVRALSGSSSFSEDEDDDEAEEEEDLSTEFFMDFESVDDDDLDYDEVIAQSARMDANGSAKIALVAIDRSIGAWRTLQISLPEKSDTIKPILIQLESLRGSAEKRFPHARDFIRPGLDEAYSDFVS